MIRLATCAWAVTQQARSGFEGYLGSVLGLDGHVLATKWFWSAGYARRWAEREALQLDAAQTAVYGKPLG